MGKRKKKLKIGKLQLEKAPNHSLTITTSGTSICMSVSVPLHSMYRCVTYSLVVCCLGNNNFDKSLSVCVSVSAGFPGSCKIKVKEIKRPSTELR